MFGLKTLERRFKTLALVVLTGGIGVGGYTYRDDPFVRGLLGRAKEKAEDNGIDVAKVEGEAKEALESLASTVGKKVEAGVGAIEKKVADKAGSSRPGTFEVAITAVKVDPDEFHAGRSAELDVRVIRHPAKGGADSVLWKGKAAARAVNEADGLLELSWSRHPFRVDWAPGDEYTIEVRDHHLLGRETPWFALDLGDDGSFPLRSKTHRLTRADGKPTRDPSSNAIVLESHRVESESDADARDPEPAVAGRDHARGATRR